MARPKLSYFDFPGSRGEECRLALHLAGIDFEDDRVPGSSWPAKKPSMPFGAMPVLEIEGKGQLAESMAILVFIGRNHDLHPADLWEAARHEQFMSVAESLRAKVTPLLAIKDDTRQATREELASGYLQTWGTNVEQALGDGPFLAGDKINVADLKLYMVVRWFATGGVDHVPTTVFKAFPKLTALYEAVGSHPSVVAWNAD